MATNYDLRLVVDADTTDARRKLDELAEAHRSPEVQEAGRRVQEQTDRPRDERRSDPRPSAPEPSAPPVRPQPRPQPPATPKPPEPKENPAEPQAPETDRSYLPKPVMTPEEWDAWHTKQVEESDRRAEAAKKKEADDFGRAAGETAGKAIGRAVAGFVGRQVVGTAFAALKTPGGDNRALNIAEQGINSGIMGGMAGYELGKGKGAAIGSMLMASVGIATEVIRQMHAVTARDNAMRFQDQNRNRGVVNNASDSAFGKQLDMAGGFRQREELLRARRQELMYGEGAWSVRNLTRKVKYYDPESDAGKNALAQLNMQKDRVAAINSQLVELGFERAAAPGRLDPSGVADTWSARGIQVGAQVDVAQVNEKIMDEVAECRALLQKIAEMGTDRPSTITDVQRAVFE